ncbi:MAG: hypothetical protein ACHQHN_19830 [Sphingobacteriales bacterium]
MAYKKSRSTFVSGFVADKLPNSFEADLMLIAAINDDTWALK